MKRQISSFSKILRPIRTGLIFILFSLSQSNAAKTDESNPDPTGFYPIWEGTGHLLSHRKIHLATHGADFGIGDVMQLGIRPIHFLYRSPNAHAKFKLFKNEHVLVAAQTGAIFLLEQASRAFLSPMYSSRLDNPDFSVTLVPSSFSVTLMVSDWLQIHQSLTGLTILSQGPIKNETVFGYSVMAEFLAHEKHSLLLHGGEVGIGNHDFSLLGASYRYQNSWFEFRLGYFYRLRSVGTQASPLLALGFWF